MEWALARIRPVGPTQGRIWPSRRPQRSASERLYFSVRALVAGGGRRVLQYGFADDRGNIVLSVFGESAGPPAVDFAPPEDLAAEPLPEPSLSALIRAVCAGASLVTYHRVLQGGLLPPGAVQAADSIECAWRRYQCVARRRGQLDGGSPATLDDALEAAGLEAVGTPDAALRALGVRDLWTWMDRVD
jgi:hypothetical protein